MKAVRLYGVGDLRVEDVDPPESPGRDEVRLRITATGICGSDLHNFRTGQWITRTPSIVGHEIAGVIEDIGSAAADLRPGDRVTVDSRFWCGACSRCLAGNRHLCERLGFVGEVCDGGCAAAATLPARLVLKVDADVDDRIIAMSEPLAVALHATRRLRIDPGQPVLIVGCGAIGGLASLALSETHDGPIFVADRNSDRAALVAQVTGATPVSLERDSLRQTIGARPILHGTRSDRKRRGPPVSVGLRRARRDRGHGGNLPRRRRLRPELCCRARDFPRRVSCLQGRTPGGHPAPATPGFPPGQFHRRGNIARRRS